MTSAAADRSMSQRTVQLRWALVWLLTAFAVYWLASHHLPVKAKHYVYMADAFLHGSLSVQNPPPDLIEVISFHGGHYFGYGVIPAILLMPFVAMCGVAFDPALVGIAIGAINVALMYDILRRLGYEEAISMWLTALFAFGTVHFHAAIWGTTWFFMQVTAVLFLLLAIREVLGRNRGLVIGLWLGAAILSRNAVLVSAPFFLVMMNRKNWSWSRTAWFGAGVLVFLMFDGWYNFSRFGSVFENGYGKVFTGAHGLFSWHYLKHNLYTYVLAPPEWLGGFPYVRPSLHGMSLLLTTPAFLFVLPSVRQIARNTHALAAWLAVACVGTLYLAYFWDGFAQFGVRYTLDYTPFLMLLTAIGFAETLRFPRIPLIMLSIIINVWGIGWWRFGYHHLV